MNCGAVHFRNDQALHFVQRLENLLSAAALFLRPGHDVHDLNDGFFAIAHEDSVQKIEQRQWIGDGSASGDDDRIGGGTIFSSHWNASQIQRI